MDEMLIRRSFLTRVGRLSIVLPAGALAVRCGGGSDGGMAPPTDGFAVTSSASSGHTHELFVPFDLVEQPATAAASLTTQAASTYGVGSHTHVVALSIDDLTSVMHGGSVDVMSSTSAGHAHAFAIRVP